MHHFLLPFSTERRTGRTFSPTSILVLSVCVAALVSIQSNLLFLSLLFICILVGGTIAHTPWGRIYGLAARFELIVLFWILLEPFMFGTTVMFYLPTPLGNLTAYWEGLQMGLLLGLRMICVIVLILGTLSHMSLSEFMGVLRFLRVPAVILGSLLVMLRYIPLFVSERQRTLESALLRGLRRGSRVSRVMTGGSLIGLTIDRAFGRSERLFDAMTLRGFGKSMPVSNARPRRADIALVLLVMLSYAVFLVGMPVWLG